MPKISVEAKREIVEDFARVINEKKTEGPKPATAVINFRNDKRDQVERPVYRVPTTLLRYRKDNGRIASDVSDYEKRNGLLDEKDAAAQEVLARFLAEKDPEMVNTLSDSLAHIGQNDPAIITSDGFLINGNRRKMVLERLPKKPGFSETMKVVILPGAKDPGGPPTLIEIEQLENRYQLQSEGKSEYYGFDRALSIKRKIDLGFSLRDQLRDDPKYANATEKELDQAVKQHEKDFLLPLECVNRYLELFGREKLYTSISKGPYDPEGRWQAFLDYSLAYHRYFKEPKWLLEKGIDEEDIGAIEDAAFKMIRLRLLKGLPKIHAIMRQLPKLAGVKESRKEVLKISDEVDANLPAKELVDAQGTPLAPEENDRRWAQRYQPHIINRVKKALDFQEKNDEKETPLALLEAALRKLNHDEMLVKNIAAADFGKARQLAAEIQTRAKDIEGEIYDYKKKYDGLGKKDGTRK
ncbi:MAG: hypothetical protein ACRENK_09390 [Gemmatimonadaceae bacterium]